MAAIQFFGVTNWLYTTRQSDKGVQTSHGKKRTGFAEYTLWNWIANFKVQTEKSFYESKSTYFTLFFIDFKPYLVDRGIFPTREFIAMTSLSLTIFSHFYFRQLFPLVPWVRDRFWYTTHAQTLCMSRSLPKSAKDSRITACVVWLYVGSTLAKVTGKWEYNDRVCVDEGLDGSALFPSAIIILQPMTQLSGAHAFRRFLSQFWTDFLKMLHKTFSSHVLTSVKIS